VNFVHYDATYFPTSYIVQWVIISHGSQVDQVLSQITIYHQFHYNHDLQNNTNKEWNTLINAVGTTVQYRLTGSPRVTTPYRDTTLGWENWPIMAASWRNFTLSPSEVPGHNSFMATSTSPLGHCQNPLLTVPKWPEPKCSMILCEGTSCVTSVKYNAGSILLRIINIRSHFQNLWLYFHVPSPLPHWPYCQLVPTVFDAFESP